MNDSTKFVLVRFVDENDAPGVIARKWLLDDGNCFYPATKTEEAKEKLLRKQAQPEESWPQYKIKILKGYDTYSEARLHLPKAEFTSNLDSEEEEQRKRRRRRLTLPGESSDSDEHSGRKRSKNSAPCVPEMGPVYPTPPTPPAALSTPPANNKQSSDNDCSYVDRVSVSLQSANTTSGRQLSIQMAHLTETVQELVKQVSDMNRKMNLIISQQSSKIEPAVPAFLTTLPVKDEQSFDSLNENLSESHNRQIMIKFLAGIGGKDARSVTTNMLRRVLLDEVAQHYSLTGKQMKNSSKKCFLKTETCRVIFQICRRILGAATTEEDMKTITSDWLNQAKSRLLRRAERQLSTHQLEIDVSQCLDSTGSLA